MGALEARLAEEDLDPRPGIALDGVVLGDPGPYLAHTLEGEMDRALEIAGLSARGFVALLEIVREETPSQESLARRLGGGRPPKAVTLTPAGRALLEETARIAMRVEAAWAARLAVEDRHGEPRVGRAYGLKRWLRECTADLRRPSPPRTQER